jgi:hypothetical protein
MGCHASWIEQVDRVPTSTVHVTHSAPAHRTAAPPVESVRLLVDGHVHVHPAFDEARFLTAACANLSRHGEGAPVLLLAEMARSDVFSRWRTGKAPWPVTRTEEEESLRIGDRLFVVAGRQVITDEKIEVLALLTAVHFPDGGPLESTIQKIVSAGAIAVLPWGVGKWLGLRGQKVAGVATRNSVFLGDNAGRPLGWPTPGLFREQRVLPGTDPLRLKSEERVVGSFGFVLSCPFDRTRPARSIRQALQQLDAGPPVFGRRTGLVGFLRQQLGLRLFR